MESISLEENVERSCSTETIHRTVGICLRPTVFFCWPFNHFSIIGADPIVKHPSLIGKWVFRMYFCMEMNAFLAVRPAVNVRMLAVGIYTFCVITYGWRHTGESAIE